MTKRNEKEEKHTSNTLTGMSHPIGNKLHEIFRLHILELFQPLALGGRVFLAVVRVSVIVLENPHEQGKWLTGRDVLDILARNEGSSESDQDRS
jgi:hypothetical protein